MPRLSINGRFLAQPVTGVQRYAMEIIRAAEELAAEGRWPDSEIVVPQMPPEALAARTLPVTMTGRLSGHPWEQAELAFRARGDVLLSLGNTAPILRRRQVVASLLADRGETATLRKIASALKNRGVNMTKRKFCARLSYIPNRMKEKCKLVPRTCRNLETVLTFSKP